ncbi:pseudouridine synthase [Comamonas guangdongensis]|uniref:Pseudouridine synthase n=1 Tax=Comamonas guangdongensis TaxID=510515 RepID=A0ABV3ZT78_9BURK
MPRPFSSSRPPSPRRNLRQPAPRPAVPRLLCFNKPYGVLSQFTSEGRWKGLADWIAVPGVHAAGRLDADSEGLLLLTNDGQLQARIADPRHKMEKTYWVQVEGIPDEAALQRLRDGVELNDGRTLPARVRLLEPQPQLWERQPPIRVRQNIPDCWIELIIREGRNRQVRRMTAAVGHPTLRLVRMAIGPYSVQGLEPGQWRDAPQP